MFVTQLLRTSERNSWQKGFSSLSWSFTQKICITLDNTFELDHLVLIIFWADMLLPTASLFFPRRQISLPWVVLKCAFVNDTQFCFCDHNFVSRVVFFIFLDSELWRWKRLYLENWNRFIQLFLYSGGQDLEWWGFCIQKARGCRKVPGKGRVWKFGNLVLWTPDKTQLDLCVCWTLRYLAFSW